MFVAVSEQMGSLVEASTRNLALHYLSEGRVEEARLLFRKYLEFRDNELRSDMPGGDDSVELIKPLELLSYADMLAGASDVSVVLFDVFYIHHQRMANNWINRTEDKFSSASLRCGYMHRSKTFAARCYTRNIGIQRFPVFLVMDRGGVGIDTPPHVLPLLHFLPQAITLLPL